MKIRIVGCIFLALFASNVAAITAVERQETWQIRLDQAKKTVRRLSTNLECYQKATDDAGLQACKSSFTFLKYPNVAFKDKKNYNIKHASLHKDRAVKNMACIATTTIYLYFDKCIQPNKKAKAQLDIELDQLRADLQKGR